MADHSVFRPSRRTLLSGAAGGALAFAVKPARGSTIAVALPDKAEPFPMEAVRLTPSIWLAAVESNRSYLMRVEPDRLLHNFRKFAGLTPKGEPYGGWEADTIAGHSLGHYLSACALMHAQTDDAECKRRADYIVGELAECQRAHRDGYVAGFTRHNGDTIENGKVLFAELMRGDIRVMPFDLNGSWVPLYNFHKTLTGLFEAHTHCGNEQALAVARGLGGYIDGVFAKLDEAQIQHVLDCEHGGLNEAFAELYARTNDKRWLALAERIYHRKVLDPLADGRDELDGLHANTQIPKLIGLARLYELTGKPHYRKAVETFWHAIVEHHSYVIGGNSDREHFQKPDTISKYITEQTCESCNTYNMLKLTRHLYAWTADSAYFDYYERAHLNHIMAQHNPATGMFAYMVPLMAGTHREWSKPFDDFWCCVGTGMESHSKHGDSIYAHHGDTLFVNQFVASALTWTERGAKFEMQSAYPDTGVVQLRVAATAPPSAFAVAMRIPPWCTDPLVRLNGTAVTPERSDGYAVLRRQWNAGDTIDLDLPMAVRAEPARDDSNTVALLHGPLVLAADLGPAESPYTGPAPALVAGDVVKRLERNMDGAAHYRTAGMGRPGDFPIKPFYQLWDRNTAVYFKRFTEAEWAAEQKARNAETKRLAELDRRSADIVRLGDETDEEAHGLTSKISYPLSYRGKPGRDARSGGFIEFTMKTGRGPLTLQATYWGDERDKLFHISVEGTRIATERLDGTGPIAFLDRDYAIPSQLTAHRARVTVRFEPEPMSRVGPVYGVRLLGIG